MPGFGAFAFEQVDDFAIECRVDDRLVAAFAHEDRDRHAPDALAADAPVGARGDHVGDAFLAPRGIPDDLVDFFDRQLAVGGFGSVGALHGRFKRDEPLLGGAEDDRVVAAPAVRVGVFEIGDGEQGTVLLEHGDDDGIGGPDFFAFEGRERSMRPRCGIDMEVPGSIDAAGLVEVIALTGVEVVCAMRGRGVDRAGALVGGDVGGEDAEDAALEERVLEGGVLELRCL